MTINPARALALSGLNLQRRRLETSSANVANATTDDYDALRVEAIAREGGGVDGRVSSTPDPGPPIVDENGEERTLSNTNLASERVVQITASRAFEANIAVFKAADEMDQALLDEKV